MRDVPAQLLGQVALDDLRVVEVELDLEVRRADLLADRVRLGLRAQQVAGHVARVERLDRHRDAVGRRVLARLPQVAHVEAPAALALARVRVLGDDPRHHVHPPAVERLRVAEPRRDRRGELVLASGHAREPAVARAHVARRRVEQRDLEPVLRDALGDVARLPLVGERELDRAEAGLRRLAEALEERHLGEQVGQIGGEPRHRAPVSRGRVRTRHRAPRRRPAPPPLESLRTTGRVCIRSGPNAMRGRP